MIDHDETEEPDVISREDVKRLKTLCSNIAKQNCDEFTAVQSECLVKLREAICARKLHDLGSPLPAVATPNIALIYSSRTASPIIIYSSRTASPVYISAEQHHPYIYAPWEWRPMGMASRHPPKQDR